MIEDWNIPLTEFQQSLTKKSDYLDAVFTSMTDVVFGNTRYACSEGYGPPGAFRNKLRRIH